MSLGLHHILLHTESLSVGYGRKAVLEDIHISAHAGTFMGLSGRNGSGKSTLIRTLAGLSKPLAGKVMVEGKVLHEQKTAFLAQHIGLVLTKRPAVDFMPVRDMISMGRYPHLSGLGKISAKDEAVVDEALEQTGITHLAGKYLNEISDGEFQKAMIARVLVQKTPVIILDEPTAFLDHESKIQLFELLRALAETQSKAIICATHDMELASRYAHGFWEAKEGRVGVKTHIN